MTPPLLVPLVAMLVAAGVTAPPTDPSPDTAPSIPSLSADVDRTVQDPAISESSGLAVSGLHDGLLWTINDSGHPPVLFGIGPDGATRARLRVDGVPNVDWEALAGWRDRSGRALLAVADIGDNIGARSGIEIDVLAEPTTRTSGETGGTVDEVSVEPLRRIRLRYPDQPVDAETLLVDAATDRMYVVTKGLFTSRIYRVPETAWPGESGEVATLELLGQVAFPLATDGAMLSSGQVVLRGYGSASLLPPPPTGAGGASTRIESLATVALPAQPQGEGIAVDGDTLYLSTEGVRKAILRARMPSTFMQALTPSVAPSDPAPEPSATGTSPDQARSVWTDGVNRRTAALGAAIGLPLVLITTAVALRRRRSRDRR